MYHNKKIRASEQAAVSDVSGVRTGWGKLCHV